LQRDVRHAADTVDGVASSVAPLDPRLTALEGRLERLSGQLAGVQATLDRLSATVADAAEHLPDRDDRAGLLTKARDALGGAEGST
jgi:ABC-type transporter Mla subunit MlaD